MKIIVTGATGLVGAEVIRQAVIDPGVERVTAITRNPLDFDAGIKVDVIIHREFLQYEGLKEVFRGHDAIVWCLGISQSQVSKAMYHTITYEYALAAATAALQANPGIAFIFVSGAGADATEKSRTLFARVKGKTENALQRLPFKKLSVVRPGGIKPVHPNPRTSFLNKLMIPLFPVFELLLPSLVISSAELARVLLHIAKHGTEKPISENTDLKELLKKL